MAISQNFGIVFWTRYTNPVNFKSNFQNSPKKFVALCKGEFLRSAQKGNICFTDVNFLHRKAGELGSLQDSFRRLRRHLLSEGGKCQGGTGESRRILRLSLGESCTFLRLPPWGKAWRRKGAKKRREPKLSSLFALGLDYLVITLKTIVVATPLASVLAPK